MAQNDDGLMLELTAEVVAAYVSKNSIPPSMLPELIASVSASIRGLSTAAAPGVPAAALPTPAVSIKKSVTPDYLISLEDGRRYKALKRHLNARGMTPSDYRVKWSLPSDYPMVAANYAATRSALAKSLGLGRKPGTTNAPKAAATKTAPAKRGRPKKVEA